MQTGAADQSLEEVRHVFRDDAGLHRTTGRKVVRPYALIRQCGRFTVSTNAASAGYAITPCSGLSGGTSSAPNTLAIFQIRRVAPHRNPGDAHCPAVFHAARMRLS